MIAVAVGVFNPNTLSMALASGSFLDRFIRWLWKADVVLISAMILFLIVKDRKSQKNRDKGVKGIIPVIR